MDCIQEIWESEDPSSDFIVKSEPTDESEVDGKHVLARVEGPAFFPNTKSGNNVYYPLAAWENALNDSEFKKKLEDRLVYGTIGHNIELNDDDIRNGLLSHIVTKAWINENNKGRAEYLILNTGPGQILNTLIRAKSKLRVSTKALGTFEATSKDGVKVINPDSFILERIDFVTNPGYTEALPHISESLINIEGKNMDAIQSILESQIVDMKNEKVLSKEENKVLLENLQKVREEHVKLSSQLDVYKEFGTAASISEDLSELRQYRVIGTVHSIHEAMEDGEETINKLGTAVDDLSQVVKDTPSYDDLGSPEQVKQALQMSLDAGDQLKAYQDLGEADDIKDALDQSKAAVDELAEYKKLGTPDEIRDALEKSGKVAEDMVDMSVRSLAAKMKVKEETVSRLLTLGLSLDDAEQWLSEIKGSDDATAAVVDVPVVGESKKTPRYLGSVSSKSIREARQAREEAKSGKINENTRKPIKESLGARLMAGKL